MLVFVDASGDAGIKVEDDGQLKPGTTTHMVVSIVVFDDHGQALACDEAITGLGRDILPRRQKEFKFAKNSHEVRTHLLRKVHDYPFVYHSFVLDKSLGKIPRLRSDADFIRFPYLYVVGSALSSMSGYLDGATVVVDESENHKKRRAENRRYLIRRATEERPEAVSKLKIERSQSNSLLQLADYTAAIVRRGQDGTRRNPDFRGIVRAREGAMQWWYGLNKNRPPITRRAVCTAPIPIWERSQYI